MEIQYRKNFSKFSSFRTPKIGQPNTNTQYFTYQLIAIDRTFQRLRYGVTSVPPNCQFAGKSMYRISFLQHNEILIPLSRLLQMTSTDKDFRFMATNDLMTELQKDSIILDDESEKKVVRMVLKLLEDKNGEVQNLAVKCLGPLVNKVKEIQVETIVDSLCANMMSNTEQLRDISSIGLKAVIAELPQSSNSLAPNVCQRITGKLSTAIEKVRYIAIP